MRDMLKFFLAMIVVGAGIRLAASKVVNQALANVEEEVKNPRHQFEFEAVELPTLDDSLDGSLNLQGIGITPSGDQDP